MNKIVFNIQLLLQDLSLDSKDKARYAEKISRYNKECGCALGSFFAVISMIIFTNYIIFSSHKIGWASFVYGFIFIMLSSALGKLSGIGLAKIKLILLYQFLLKQRE